MSQERVGVIIVDNVVVNSIIWADHTPDQLVADGFTEFQEITHLSQRPSIGWSWSEADGYRPPKPYPSWTWDGLGWTAPVAMPTDGGPYQWNEQTQTWDTIPTPTE